MKSSVNLSKASNKAVSVLERLFFYLWEFEGVLEGSKVMLFRVEHL